MSLMHCPLCLGLAVLSVCRALAHLSLVALTPLKRLAWRQAVLRRAWHSAGRSAGGHGAGAARAREMGALQSMLCWRSWIEHPPMKGWCAGSTAA